MRGRSDFSSSGMAHSRPGRLHGSTVSRSHHVAEKHAKTADQQHDAGSHGTMRSERCNERRYRNDANDLHREPAIVYEQAEQFGKHPLERRHDVTSPIGWRRGANPRTPTPRNSNPSPARAET